MGFYYKKTVNDDLYQVTDKMVTLQGKKSQKNEISKTQ